MNAHAQQASFPLEDEELRRYMRQVVVGPFGINGQAALKASRVLIVGAGGLGAPVVTYLAAAGVGTIGIVDDDEVVLSNLNRQFIYRSDDVGQPKVECAAAFVGGLNDNVKVATYATRLDDQSAVALVERYDLVVDGTDNIATRRTTASAALRCNKVLVTGAVGQLEGHVAVFRPTGIGVPAGFDRLYPGRDGVDASCEAVGIIGAVAGVIGSLMAMEVIKLLSGIGNPAAGRVVHYDALRCDFVVAPLDGIRPRKYLVGG